MAVNDITGKVIKSGVISKEGRDNWDNIFSKKTAYEWAKIDNIEFNDDGWDTPDVPITYRQFKEKIAQGTIITKNETMDYIKV